MGFEWGARGVRGRTGSLRAWQMRSGTDEDVIDAVFPTSGARTGRAMAGCAKQGGKAIPWLGRAKQIGPIRQGWKRAAVMTCLGAAAVS